MRESSKLLINEHPLQALPTLAKLLDLNKAVILQQIQYWLGISGHEIDGYVWIYNSYTEWTQQFPWLTPRGVRWHIKGLEKIGLIVAGEYNKDARDNTKWYRIDYEKLNALLQTSDGVAQSVTPEDTERQVQVALNVKPLPETTSKTTSETTNNKPKLHFGEFENVLLTYEELKKLVCSFGEKITLQLIETLSAGIESKGYKYKSHYAAILNWHRRDLSKEAKVTSKKKDYLGGRYGHVVRTGVGLTEADRLGE